MRKKENCLEISSSSFDRHNGSIRMSIPIPRGLIAAIRDKVGVIVQLEVDQLTRY